MATVGDPLPAPGLPFELDASSSAADQPCIGGVLQFQFWTDGNKDGIGPGVDDTLVRDWTDNALLLQACTAGSSRYVVNTRCSSAPGCVGSGTRDIECDCPISGARTHGGPIFEPIFAGTDKNTIFWATAHDIDVIGGPLSTVSVYGQTMVPFNDTGATSYDTSASDGTGSGSNEQWYLIRESGSAAGDFCNSPGGTNSWKSGGANEDPDRDAEIIFP